MSLLKKIQEQKTNYNSFYLYFVTKKSDFEFDTKKLDQNKIQKLKNDLKTKYKMSTIQWQQIEKTYNKMLKIEKIYKNNVDVTYSRKLDNNYFYSDDTLLIMENNESIDKECFPPLSDENYDNIAKKNCEKISFNGFDVLFVSENNDENIVCVSVSNANNEKQFNEILAVLKN
jgi:hypothetical protein